MCLEANGLPTYEGMNEITAGVINTEATKRVQQVIGPSCPVPAVPSAHQLCHSLLQLGIGQLVGALSEQVKVAAKCAEAAWNGDCATSPRLALYSGHDTTLLPLSAGRCRDSSMYVQAMHNMLFFAVLKAGPSGRAVNTALFVTRSLGASSEALARIWGINGTGAMVPPQW